MNKFLKLAAVSCFAMAGASAASAGTFTFDFESLTANSILDGSVVTIGSTDFRVTSSGNGTGANIFDTLDGTTSDLVRDDDIVPVVQGENDVAGKVLILQSTTDGGGLANDQAGNGTITFELLSGNALSFIGASAIDDGAFTFGTSVDGDLALLQPGADRATASAVFASSFLSVGDSFFVDYRGSGAVDAFVFDDGLTVVPVPATLPLLLGALGGFGYMVRRRQSRNA